MDHRKLINPIPSCHVVAVPFPGRGHINPMMCLCQVLASRKPEDILITFVVTQEWLQFIGSEPKPDNIRFAGIPNVIPSEVGRGADQPNFYETVLRNMRTPVEKVLDDQLQTPATVIIADTYLVWSADIGNQRNIPVASLWTSSATVYSVFQHFDLLVQNRHFPVNLIEKGEETVDYIPGVPPTRIADLPTCLYGKGQRILAQAIESIKSTHTKAQYLILSSHYDLEPQAIDALTAEYPIPVYHVGPNIPYIKLFDTPNWAQSQGSAHDDKAGSLYYEWLNKQPRGSVLYVSQGSLFSTSKTQMAEIAAGLRESGVRYFWVGREDCARLSEECGENGIVVPWCDQLRVLCHPSLGGFWSHCGWNATYEAILAGLPVLTFPIYWDQVTNSKMLVEDWKIGWRVKQGKGDEEVLVTKEEIKVIVKRFMDVEREEEVRNVRRRAAQLRDVCVEAVRKGGSSHAGIDDFINHIMSNSKST